MRSTTLSIIFATVVLLGGLSLPAPAQDPTPVSASAASNDVVGESDRLPFMHSEQEPEQSEPSSGGLLLKTFGALLLVVGLIFFGAWGARKLGFGVSKTDASGNAIELAVLSSVSLGSGRSISTVRFGERVLLLGVTSQALTLLAEDRSDEFPLPGPTRSVAELLAEENDSFGDQFDLAHSKLGNYSMGGQDQ